MSRRGIALGLILAGWLASGLSTPAQERHPSPERYLGLPLTEALLQLEAHGLDILFTSQVVKPDMSVVAEPTATSPRGKLDQLLTPHGLRAEGGPRGTLVIVPGPPRPAAIRGVVRQRYTATPVVGVQVRIPGTAFDATSDQDGSFSIPEVPAGLVTLEARLPGFVVETRNRVELLPGQNHEIDFELVPAPVPLDEIVVTPSLITLLRSDPVTRIALDRDEILALPHLGDDLFRALTLLPGTTGEEFSARFNVRGGRTDEVLVRLDQLELFDPYHIQDFSGSLSFIAPQAIDKVDLFLGGFPAAFGDRMSGVLDMRTVEPDDSRGHLGLSIIGAQAGGSGQFDDQRANWLAVARYGSLEAAEDFIGAEVQPEYWDGFGKLTYAPGARHTLGARLLHADDRLDTTILEDGDLENTHTDYRSLYAWISHRVLMGKGLFADSVISSGRIDRDRRAEEMVGDELEFRVRDQRVLDFWGFKQDWHFEPNKRHYLRWGLEARRLDAEYDYLNEIDPDDSLDEIRDGESLNETTQLRRTFDGEQYGAYFSERLVLAPRLTAELGLRYDEHSVPGDRDLSPRANLVADLGKSTLRVAWGHYFQSQRLYELQVEDGETGFLTSERTEQFGLGVEHAFSNGASLRLDFYHRDITSPRPRYENLYEPVDSFPEVQPDRVRIAPERSRARGVEIFLRGRPGGELQWWLNYAHARAEDEIDGRDVPRRFDQPHTLNLDVNYRLGPHWSLNVAFRYHTGWPTTEVLGGIRAGGEDAEEAEADAESDFETVPVFGPIYGRRLPDYHRLDLRASRQWQLKKGLLSLFIDIQNLYDRENIAGFDVEFGFLGADGCNTRIDDACEAAFNANGLARVIPVEETWGGTLPSFGIDWKF